MKRKSLNLRRSSSRLQSKAKTEDVRPNYFASAKSKLLAACVTLLIGYASALIISPGELRRYFFLHDPNDFVGEWVGSVAGSAAILKITSQDTEEGRSSFTVEGVLTIRRGGVKKNIVVRGVADGNVSLRGKFDDNNDIVLSLSRNFGELNTPDEKHLLLQPIPSDTSGVSLCRSVIDTSSRPLLGSCALQDGQTFLMR